MLLFPIAIQAEDLSLMPQEEIAEAPGLDPITEAEINALLGENLYVGESDWRVYKFSNKKFMSAKRMNNRN